MPGRVQDLCHEQSILVLLQMPIFKMGMLEGQGKVRDGQMMCADRISMCLVRVGLMSELEGNV